MLVTVFRDVVGLVSVPGGGQALGHARRDHFDLVARGAQGVRNAAQEERRRRGLRSVDARDHRDAEGGGHGSILGIRKLAPDDRFACMARRILCISLSPIHRKELIIRLLRILEFRSIPFIDLFFLSKKTR